MAITSKEEAVSPIHPHIFHAPELKLPDPKVSYLESLSTYITNEEAKKSANAVIIALENAYTAFTSALESTTVSEEGFLAALRGYVSVLLALINRSGELVPSGTAGGGARGLDAALEQASRGVALPALASLATAKSFSGRSPLRYAVKYSWNQVLLGKGKAQVPDAAFELLSVLIAGGVWSMRRAEQLCDSNPHGVPTSISGKAYKLLLQAAGLFDFASRAVLPLCAQSVTPKEAPDCSLEALQAIGTCALADAQSITVLRAIQKGILPSLVASLARDTRDQYKQVSEYLANIRGAPDTKLAVYARYKYAAFDAYAHIFNGIDQWRNKKIGAGLRSLKEAEAAWFLVKKASAVFDKAAPATLGKAHSRFDDEIDRGVYDAMRRMEKENGTVYFQQVPTDAPLLPEGRRLAISAPFSVPEKSRDVTNVDYGIFSNLPASIAERKGKAVTSNKPSGGNSSSKGICCFGGKGATKGAEEVVKKDEKSGGGKNKHGKSKKSKK